MISDGQALDKLTRKLWETEKWTFDVDDSNTPQKASCFDKERPVGIAIAAAPGESYYIDLVNFSGGPEIAVASLNDLLSNVFLDKAAYDLKRELAVLRKLDIEVESAKDDVMIASYLLDSTRTNISLPFLAQTNLDLDAATEIPEGFDESIFRTCERADIAYRLAPLLADKIVADGLEKVYREIELPLVPVLADIEIAGMKVDGENLKAFSEYISTELETLKDKIFAISGREFNIGSPKQVGEILNELNIETGRKTATGQISTSRDILIELAQTYEIAQMIIDYRELDKLKATYADALPKMIGSDGRIHGCLNQTVAATGRLSSTDPNLQNIPDPNRARAADTTGVRSRKRQQTHLC